MQVLAASLLVGGPALAPLPVFECVRADNFSNVLKEGALWPVCADEALKYALASIADVVSPSVYAFVPPVESLHDKLYSYRGISNTGFRGNSFALKEVLNKGKKHFLRM